MLFRKDRGIHILCVRVIYKIWSIPIPLLLKIIYNKLFLMHLFVSLLHFAVISELIHYTAARNSGGVSEQMPLIQVIVPQVMNLRAQLRDSSKVTI